ncbi:hypothetical protein PHMEG_00039234 [Phytophthora megakarya]|uniref:RNase H type-1 domain-containing protein n=1 Tax=Phytophthora megakarya TaxID=4795 RepID=A0A225UG89_9STRA|nr:hypothetical protein PHMEG_00039234 [Phytophthora megakarya]
MLSLWHLVVMRVKEKDCGFAQLLQAGLTSFVDLEDSPCGKRITESSGGPGTAVRTPATMLHNVVMSFDGSAKTEKYGGVTAASAFLESTTVNVAEYSGMNNGVTAALDHGVEELVIVGDSRLAIQQSLGVIA